MSFKKAVLFLFALSISAPVLFAQTDSEGSVYTITDKVVVPHTSVKNQSQTGTCWCFAGTALVEAEIMRKHDVELDLSEMYSVYWAYSAKVAKYVRMHGNNTLSQGGEVCDVLYAIENAGMVPESEYNGLNYGTERHIHGEFCDAIRAYAGAIIKNSNRQLSTAWQNGLNGILDAYLGVRPESFEYNGKKYTPKSFAEKYPIKTDDYVQIASFMNADLYKPFHVEIPDNWTWTQSYNIMFDDLLRVLDNALDNGYTVGWAQDVSDKGFSRKTGLGIVPEDNPEVLRQQNPDKYGSMTDSQIKEKLYSFEEVVAEKKVTEELHQKLYDNWQVTDDHSMLIVGYAFDQNNTKYYKVKNSWGTENMVYDGYWYCSEEYVKLHTIFFTLNKGALPKDIKKKLNL